MAMSWEIRYRNLWIDVKKNLISIILTCAVVLMGILQYSVYVRQTELMNASKSSIDALTRAARESDEAANRSAVAASNITNSVKRIHNDSGAQTFGDLGGATNAFNGNIASQPPQEHMDQHSRISVNVNIVFNKTMKEPVLDFVLHNSGGTPVNSAHMDATFSTPDLEPTPHQLERQISSTVYDKKADIAISPQGDTKGQWSVETRESEARELLAGFRTAYFWGALTYNDEHGLSHKTRFCYFSKPSTAPATHLCPVGNEIN